MNTEPDPLLEHELLDVPTHFTARVMAQVQTEAAARPDRQRWRQHLQWLVLACGTAAGAAQMAAWLTCLWAAGAAL